MELREILGWLMSLEDAVPPRVYLVGGSVRDGLLGRPLVDLDLAVRGDALAAGEALARALDGAYVPLGERYGACRVVLPNDGDGSLHQIDVVSFDGGIEADLARRDFTVDAMAVAARGFDGDWGAARIIDPHGGRSDLAAGVLRMVSPQVLDDDPLRLIRAVRLSAELGFAIEPNTADAVRARAATLAAAAPERVRTEFCRILTAEGTVTWIDRLDELGLLAVLLPELTYGRGVGQPKEHHWDVFRHQVETVATAEVLMTGAVSPKLGGRPYLQPAAECRPAHPRLEGYFTQRLGDLQRSTLVKLAALVHDVGKPDTKTIEPAGRMRFFGHPELGATMVKARLQALRFSNAEVDAVTTMVAQHMRPAQWRDSGAPTQKALFKFFRDLGPVAIDTLFLNLADHLGARGPDLIRSHWEAHVAWTDQILAWHFDQVARTAVPRPVTGADLMECFGLPPGRQVGALLAEIEEARAAGTVVTKEQALALAAKRLVERSRLPALAG